MLTYLQRSLAVLLIGISCSASAQTWNRTGPVNFPVNVSGQINGIARVTQLKFHPTLAGVLYATSASGGLFRSTDGGENWAVLGTDKFPSTSCASVCIDYTNDNILYLGTGDPNYYGTDFGIYKTTDGGATWALSNANIGNRLAVEMLMDPADHNIVVAATNDGIWRTTNGGASWTNVKSGGGFRDMKRRPNTNTLYAVTNADFWISTDFGVTWSQVNSGLTLPAGTDGLRLGVSAAANNVVYVIADGHNGVIFKSVNAGVSFTEPYSSNTQCIVCYSPDPASGSQGNYNLAICGDPSDANHVYVASHCLWESNDGGNSFQQKTEWYANLHTDHHQVDVDPYDVNRLWNINDGGIWKRRGTNDSLWDPKSNGIGATEIYHAAQAKQSKKLVSIGTQDNGELFYDGIWKTNRGGDWGSRVAFDYSAANTIYYLENGKRRTFTPYGGENDYNSPFNPSDNSAIAFQRNLPDIALLGKDSLYVTGNLTSATPSWTDIYPSTSTIRDICISAADSSIAYVVSANTKFTRVTNLLGTPVITALTAPNATSQRGSVASVKGNVNVVYVSCNNKIFRSPDQGATWVNVTYNLPGTNILKIYHDDFSNDETVYVCTGNKVFSKNGAATAWTDLTDNLPSIANITDFMIYNDGTVASKLKVSYYGRAVWEYDLHANYPPVADFSLNNTYICPGQSVQFTDLSEGGNLTYNWSFPGGTPATSAQQNPVVVYVAPGTYSVTLTVTNANGSNSKTLNSTIVVGVGSAQPIAEGFEGNTFPPVGWRLFDAGNDGVNWYQSTSAGGFGASAKSAAFDNYNNDTQGGRDRLELPVLDLTGFSGASLHFDVAYAPYSTTSYLDSLLVGVSTDCGATFTYLYTKAGAALATAPVNTTAPFIPTASQWRTETIALSNYLSSANLLIAFENRGRYGQQLFVDNVNLASSPIVSFKANDTTVCAGSSVNFNDQSTGLVTNWSWTFPGGTPASSSQQNPAIIYNTPGLYNVTLTVGSAGGGTATKTKAGYIRVFALPAPAITVNGALLTSNIAGTNYQWFLNTNAIPGAVQQTYTVLQNGSYTVEVTDANGCSGISAPVVITLAPVVVTPPPTTTPPVSTAPAGLQIFPVPSGGSVFITSGDIKGAARLKLYNAAGALVLDKTIADMSVKNEIDISTYARGVYELKLFTEKGVYLRKIERN